MVLEPARLKVRPWPSARPLPRRGAATGSAQPIFQPHPPFFLFFFLRLSYCNFEPHGTPATKNSVQPSRSDPTTRPNQLASCYSRPNPTPPPVRRPILTAGRPALLPGRRGRIILAATRILVGCSQIYYSNRLHTPIRICLLRIL